MCFRVLWHHFCELRMKLDLDENIYSICGVNCSRPGLKNLEVGIRSRARLRYAKRFEDRGGTWRGQELILVGGTGRYFMLHDCSLPACAMFYPQSKLSHFSFPPPAGESLQQWNIINLSLFILPIYKLQKTSSPV